MDKTEKNLVVFEYNVLFVPGTDDLTPLVTGNTFSSEHFLKVFISTEKEPGFTWEKICMLNRSRLFCGHCVSISDYSEPGTKSLLRKLIGWIAREQPIGNVSYIGHALFAIKPVGHGLVFRPKPLLLV